MTLTEDPPEFEMSIQDRVSSLRHELKQRGLGGFIVPHADEHQCEYLTPSAERLAWVTGFTGSAGQAVILADGAAVFVDGRYTLQVQAQVDDVVFERCHSADTPARDWLADNLPAGAKLGYDPWLHTPAQITEFDAVCCLAGGEMVPLDDNPIDAVWPDRPAPSLGPIVAHDEAFTGRSSADKRTSVAAAMATDRVDAAVLSAPDSIAWLLNVRGADVPYSPMPLSFAILADDASLDWFVDSRKLTAELDRHLGADVRIHAPDVLGLALDQLGEVNKTVRLDPARSPAILFKRLERAGARIDLGVDPCQLPKAKKTVAELNGFRAAHKRDGAAVTQFLAWLAANAPCGGITETAAADQLEALRSGDERFRGLSFPTISGAGPNGAIVHYRVSQETNRELQPGSLYLVDSGAQYLDGTTDITRTVAIGEPTAEMRRNFTLVLKGHIALGSAKFPVGTSGSQLDVLARRALWEHGFDYDHGTGHGVGSYLCVHEGPQRIAKTPNQVALELGMVISNEPGYYKTGEYGIRIENLVAVTDAGGSDGQAIFAFETLSLAPIDRNLVDLTLMTTDEISWLDAYHARVRETLTPLVDEKTAAWLVRATAPLT